MTERAPVRLSWTVAAPGLFLCLVGPALILVARAQGLFGSDRIARILGLEIGLWLLVAALTALILRLERRSLRSIGLGRLRWSSLGWAVAASAVIVLSSGAVAFALDLAPPSARQFAAVEAAPLWVRLLMLATAGVTEEVLSRGYPISRLRELTGSLWIAALLPLAIFVMLHWPFMGPGHVVFVSMVGLVTTALFVWRRDLWSNILTHLLVDIPFLVAPMVLQRLSP